MPQYNIALGLEYNGGAFCGWQRQRHSPSVQEELESALSQVAGQPVKSVAAGRTDTGVHATKQVVSIATSADRPLKAWREGVNSLTRSGVKVRWARTVDADFHARHSATARRYVYLYRVDAAPAPLRDAYSLRVPPLDAQSMYCAAQSLVGEHDFTSFRAAACQSRSRCRQVHRLEVRAVGDFIVLDIQANAFLLHMVRNIAGALMQVGDGRQSPGWIDECLQAKERRLIGKTAPARGLYLVDVLYPEYDFPRGTAPPLLGSEELHPINPAAKPRQNEPSHPGVPGG